ncbi:CDP-diacylglycerol--serine O-phosphatidyltransferase [Clostridium hydrogenum]|uniref:CDP-diacylglycerol--serine O-phosphatidyltransferase n=1 Tax=Clostridium hydrogenum TaxID=2855764 RepID=UPI001F35F588|nr:CDP-diacylglycerol--serine O-phosphatidyltransferase [Clostridium hydrogenum]
MAKSAVANMFTFGNLSCGLLSLTMTLTASSQNNPEYYKLACVFILLAGIIDRYDGRVARALNVSSELGKELDSLADLVSFGVAPSILSYNLLSSDLKFVSYILLLMFPIAGAYRLARYNLSNFDGNFTGIPITVAGMAMALYFLIILLLNSTPNPILTVIIMVLLSYLMISKLKFKKF